MIKRLVLAIAFLISVIFTIIDPLAVFQSAVVLLAIFLWFWMIVLAICVIFLVLIVREETK